MTQTASHATLGALVRERRTQLGLSMDQLAQLARVSRSSIHRLEHGHEIRPTPAKLARVLAVVGIDADGVLAALPDDEYRGDVLHWLERAEQATALAGEIESAARFTPDLVVIGTDGTTVMIEVKGGGPDAIAAVLKSAGYLVTRPDQ